MLFWRKKKKELTTEDIMAFVDNVIMEYSHAVQTKTGSICKLSSLPYPINVIKACIKVDAANTLTNSDYIDTLATCYSYLSDFIDDELIPKGPTMFSLGEKYGTIDETNSKLVMKELLANMSSVDRGNEIYEQINKTRQALVVDITSFLKDIGSYKQNKPTENAKQIWLEYDLNGRKR